jgi:class 3 adenylate cyclase/tetratricopeptide (TPR) repeat protein
MDCPSCQHENPSGSRFCNACGAELSPRCHGCGRENPPGSRFCNGCGASLTGEAEPRTRDPREYTPRHLAERILHQKSALEGERKHVTVLFADLADSTALAEAVDPEEMHALMDRAFGPILEQVHRYEGTVNQFTGDGVMALFGAPIALEDAPRRAVSAALAIHEALAVLGREVRERFGRDFRMRIGIHTGPVVVGSIGDDLRMDYTAVGDTTNLAARLEQSAEAGSVVISDTTRRLCQEFFDLEALAPLSLKGKREPVTAWRVVAERPVSGRIEALADTALTRYVGRDRELDALKAAFESAASGRGQVVFVVGDAGIGKSRLLFEFRRSLRDVPHTWLEGRCASYARTTPFHAISDGWRRLFGIDDRDDEPAAKRKVESEQSQLGPDLDWTLPYLRGLLSLPIDSEEVESLDPMTRRSETSRALQARLLRCAERETVVLVIEDLHWIDAASEEFIGFLADSIPAARVLIVLTHRPGYQQPFGDRSYHVRIPVQALSTEAMSAMLSAVLEAADLPEDLQRLIARKAEGNPLFIEELTHSLLEEGILSLEDGHVRLSRDLADVSIPDRIQDVLMARLDRLAEEPRRAIQMASVIGREFALRLLERITETGKRLDGIVSELRSLELIYEKASHPELAYMFKHALTHDVAYESVLVQRRKALHQVVGSAIEELYPDRLAEHWEALAHHFTEAEEWEKAFLYHDRASRKSAHAWANRAARAHCEAAIEIAERLGDAVDRERLYAVWQRLGACCWSLSEFRPSADAFARAAELTDDPEARALNLARAAFSYLWNHDYEPVDASVDSAYETARALDVSAGRAFAMAVRDESNLIRGHTLDDDSTAEEALAMAERAGEPGTLIMCLAQTIQRAVWRGEYRRAIALARRANAVAEREHLAEEALFCAWFDGMAQICLGRYGHGLGAIRAGTELCDRIGDRAIKARMLNTAGWALAEFGAHRRARDYNRQSAEMAHRMVELGLVAGAPEVYANAAVNLSGNLVALGEIEAAADALGPVLEELETSDDPWMRWRYSLHVLHTRGRIELARGAPERALALAEEEMTVARERFALKLVARAGELRGRVLLTLDARDEAEETLRETLALGERIEYAPVAWRARALLGALARRRGDAVGAKEWFVDAGRAVDEAAATVDDADLKRDFAALKEQLIADPLGALR